MTGRRGLHVLLHRSWALAALAVLAAMAVCIALGLWQYGRFEEKSARADLIARNFSAEPTDLASVLPRDASPLAGDDSWRTVRLQGRWCTQPGCVLYVRNRSYHGDVGFWQLVPFRTDHGTLLVVRGWVRVQETQSRPQSPPAVPEGDREIVVRMRPLEPRLEDRRSPAGQVQSVNIAEVAAALPPQDGLRRGGYGQLAQESPAPPTMPVPLERPDTSLGPHLSYAVQWWAFAAFFPIAWVVRARRAVLDETAPRTPSPATEQGAGDAQGADERPVAPRPPERGPRRRSRDEEEEDALIDGL